MPCLPPHPCLPAKPSSASSGRGLFAVLIGGALAVGCDSANHGKDASPTASHRLSQISVRMDLANGPASSMSVLAFRAEAVDVSPSDVLGAVDPLVTPAPENGCELRDVAGTARMVRAQGGLINLEELGGVALQSDDDADVPMIPAPRVYPPLADVVSGVIAEAGPKDLAQVPGAVRLSVPTQNGDVSVKLALPQALSVSDATDKLLDGKTPLTVKGDLVLHVVGPARTALEVRPFGAPSAITCAVSSGGWVVVPSDLLVKLAASAGSAPVSIEAVWRENRLVSSANDAVRVSFEARSSTVVELRP